MTTTQKSSTDTTELACIPSGSAVADIHQIVKRAGDIEILDVMDGRNDGQYTQVASVPEGRKLASLQPFLDETLDRPRRRKGTSKLTEESSFIEVVNRFSTVESAVFADPSHTSPSFLAIFDYHPGPDDKARPASWLGHRAKFEIRMSEQWLAWHHAHGQYLSQADFAAFLEERIQDVVLIDTDQDPRLADLLSLIGGKVASASKLMELSRGLAVSQNIGVRNAVQLSTGEVNIQYVESHEDGAGQPLTVPNVFFIGIPVFYAGQAYRIAVRLRYKIRDGKIFWSVLLHRADLVFEDAFAGLRKKIADTTGLPVFLGSPEV